MHRRNAWLLLSTINEIGRGGRVHPIKLKANPSTHLTAMSSVDGSMLCIRIECGLEFVVKVYLNRKLG